MEQFHIEFKGKILDFDPFDKSQIESGQYQRVAQLPGMRLDVSDLLINELGCFHVLTPDEKYISHNSTINVRNAIELRDFLRPKCESEVEFAQPGFGNLADVKFAVRDSATAFNLVDHLIRQRRFSLHAFGPNPRLMGVVDHIRKELEEIKKDPTDLKEWVDVIILGCDGAMRAGHTPTAIIEAIVAKQTLNEQRSWPDWQGVPEDQAIEHHRGCAACDRGDYSLGHHHNCPKAK